MIQHLMNHIPDYMDDRLTLKIMLSDNLQYMHYNLLPSNVVSSWYDPSQDKAFSAFSLDDVPEQFKDKLIQHNSGISTQNIMCPNLKDGQLTTTSNSKTIKFLKGPDFEGDFFKISWDAGKDDNAISIYQRGFNVQDLQHTYAEYGEHIIKFSTNIKNIYMYTYYDSSLRSYANDRICEITSRCSSLEHFRDINYSRCLQNINAHSISSIDSEWYDGYELTSIDLPDLETITCAYAVNCLYNLKKFNAPRLKFINNATGMFKGDVSLEQAYFPELTCISGDYSTNSTGKGYNFMTNFSLTSVYMPKLISGMKSDFSYCINLKETNFSSLSAVEDNMFRDCLCLKEIKLPSVTAIKTTAFYRCQNLKTIDLSQVDAVPTLANKNAFTGLPADYKILVSRNLYNQFITATNWKTAEVKSHIVTS